MALFSRRPLTPHVTRGLTSVADVIALGIERKQAENQFTIVDKANLLTLTVPEMTALVGGMRALGANAGGSRHGVLTDEPGTLSNDYFVNLLDLAVEWRKAKGGEHLYEAVDRASGEVKWTGTAVDLVFGSNSELRAVAEVYAFNGSQEKFINDFVAAWTKVMTLDRFDVQGT